MKKIILIAVIGFGAWSYYTKNEESMPTQRSPEMVETRTGFTIQPSQSSFRCDGRQHCSQMTSRAEAEFFARSCPDTKMDGDRDGIPCENDTRF